MVNQHFVYYTSAVITEIQMHKHHFTKYPRAKWEFMGTNKIEKEFKFNFFVTLRTFFKIWCRHRLVNPSDMLRDTAGTKYLQQITTKCEFDWFKYRATFVLRDASKLTSTTTSKLLTVLRPYEKDALADLAAKDLNTLFGVHRVDPMHRGYVDWLRFLLAGSVFATHVPEFTTDNSKYALHQGQTLPNNAWFKQANFPFLWYMGGRYHVYCNGTLWHVFDLPRDLSVRLERGWQSNPETYLTEDMLREDGGDKITKALSAFLNSELAKTTANAEFDDHFYLGANTDIMRGLLISDRKRCMLKFRNAGLSTQHHNLRSEEEEEEEEEHMGSSNASGRESCEGSLHSTYITLCKMGLENLQESQDSTFPNIDLDDGDTFYDTLALWVCMVQENHECNETLAKSLRVAIRTSCEVLLDMCQRREQRDASLVRVNDKVVMMRDMLETYEREYL